MLLRDIISGWLGARKSPRVCVSWGLGESGGERGNYRLSKTVYSPWCSQSAQNVRALGAIVNISKPLEAGINQALDRMTFAESQWSRRAKEEKFATMTRNARPMLTWVNR